MLNGGVDAGWKRAPPRPRVWPTPSRSTTCSRARRSGRDESFSWLSFGGRLLMWRALKHAVPETDHKTRLVLLLFVPSLVSWHGTIGKEPLMMLVLGWSLTGLPCWFRAGCDWEVPSFFWAVCEHLR